MKSPTLSDIAALTGLTKSAVSLALRHDPRIPEITRKRVKRAASKIGYQRNAVVAHLMSQLRIGEQKRGRPTVALLNLNEDPKALRTHPTIPTYVQGVLERTESLGYTVDLFHEPAASMDGKRLLKILQARGIRGCILTGLMRSNRLPSPLLPVISTLPCVITGVRTLEPQLPFACADHHAVAQLALAKALEMGRQRPALVLDQEIDALVQGRFSAGFLIAQRELSARNRIPPFYHCVSGKSPTGSFVTWWNRYRPDAIISLFHSVENWLKVMGVSIPNETSLIQLEVRQRQNEWAGVNQHNDRTGAAAVDLLIQMIHTGETAITAQPRAMLIEPSWVAGATLPEF